jgi:hypothetical protein
MTMHLAHPSLSTTGKKRGKQKYASADAKRTAETLRADWEALKRRNNITNEKKTRAKDMKGDLKDTYKLTAPPGREAPRINSRDTGWVPCTRPADKVYTGTMIKGIGTMHKSNAVPIFSNEEAVEISTMRR